MKKMKFKAGDRVWDIANKSFVIFKKLSEEHSMDTLAVIERDNGKQHYPIRLLHQTADDMFKEFGYIDNSFATKGWFLLEKDFGSYIEEIRIDLLTGDYKKSRVFKDHKMMWSGTITKEEHLAIHQKLIELEWIE